jgi:type III pantothenate kinase
MSDRVLLIDLGNSRMSWTFYSEGEIQAVNSCSTMAEIMLEIEAQWRDISPVPVYIANVAGSELQQVLLRWFETHWHSTPVVLRSQHLAHGVTNAYSRPEELGVDRWLALIGARAMSWLPVCVVDCGSAVTIDVMDASGIHQGGIIIPGYEMMLSSLKRGTAIPEFQQHAGSLGLLGKSTSECIHTGCVNSIAAIIDRVMQSGSQLQRLFITGGNAAIITPLLEHPSRLIPDLVFRGMVQYVQNDVKQDDAKQ